MLDMDYELVHQVVTNDNHLGAPNGVDYEEQLTANMMKQAAQDPQFQQKLEMLARQGVSFHVGDEVEKPGVSDGMTGNHYTFSVSSNQLEQGGFSVVDETLEGIQRAKGNDLKSFASSRTRYAAYTSTEDLRNDINTCKEIAALRGESVSEDVLKAEQKLQILDRYIETNPALKNSSPERREERGNFLLERLQQRPDRKTHV